MSYAVNTSPSPTIVTTSVSVYSFPILGYYIENAELAPFITDGTLVRQSTISPSNVLATRKSTFSGVSNEDLQENQIALTTAIVNALASVSVDLHDDHNIILNHVEEVERHYHNREIWYGVGGNSTTSTPYTLTSGIGVFGNWVELLSAVQTPFRAAMEHFDPHRIMINEAGNTNPWRIQLAWGASGAAALLDDNYTEVVVQTQQIANQTFSGPVEIRTLQVSSGVPLWARCLNAAADDIKIFLGIHEYPAHSEMF